MRQKRSTTGGAAVPYYPGSEKEESAKHLRLIAGRFLKGNATEAELREACVFMFEALDKEASK